MVFQGLKSRQFAKILVTDTCSNYPDTPMILDLIWPPLQHFFPQLQQTQRRSDTTKETLFLGHCASLPHKHRFCVKGCYISELNPILLY